MSDATVPGIKRLSDLYRENLSTHAIARDPEIVETLLSGIEKESSRRWKVYHTIRGLISSGLLEDRGQNSSETVTGYPRKSERETAVVLGDIHYPYEDPAAVSVARQILQILQPDLTVFNGDVLDFYQLSRFEKNPKRHLQLQEDLDRARVGMREFREAVPDTEMVLHEGNHEDRLKKFKWKHPELSNLNCLKIEELLDLESIGCKVSGLFEPLCWHGWTITHGNLHRRKAGYTAHAMIERYGTSGISNHVHRLAVVERTNLAQQATWIENACLCDLRPHYDIFADWQQGLTVLSWDGHRVWWEMVPIFNGMAHFRGQPVVAD